MAEQLTFELADAPLPSFANFVSGPNAEAVTALRRVADGALRETGVVIWGTTGAGKSHLLQACVAAAGEGGRTARFFDHPRIAPEVSPAPGALIAIDDVDAADPEAQARLFTLYNALVAAGGQLVAAAQAPPARMPLRDDLRTRLGWGLVYEIVPLEDAGKPAALVAFAEARGFVLPPEAIDYLLAHGRRDMASLVRALTALDRHSLALRRPITVPLIRDWLQRDLLQQ